MSTIKYPSEFRTFSWTNLLKHRLRRTDACLVLPPPRKGLSQRIWQLERAWPRRVTRHLGNSTQPSPQSRAPRVWPPPGLDWNHRSAAPLLWPLPPPSGFWWTEDLGLVCNGDLQTSDAFELGEDYYNYPRALGWCSFVFQTLKSKGRSLRGWFCEWVLNNRGTQTRLCVPRAGFAVGRCEGCRGD